MFESVFMFVDAELNFSFFVLLGNDEFAVTVREGVDTVQDIFEQRNHWLTERSTAETLSEREGVVGGYWSQMTIRISAAPIPEGWNVPH